MLVLLLEVPREAGAYLNCFQGTAEKEVEVEGMPDCLWDMVSELAVNCHMLMDLRYFVRWNASVMKIRGRIGA